ncbi:alpha/beta hydrolase [Mycobacterium sp. CBMA271]|uniref:alpha/beta hydrolase n=1 Tax=unclassified Mycobacteroides TaxID=2618759 RepID=UPI00132B2708|nr:MULTISPECIES: alpha/beta hydrolase [unclassified Mycobacteroides]MUM18107.1 esterase [Mycobacteroides sp. CBMA 326]MUM23408.1 alpha/beta hydrolase [Mycobacteroides sp. CBMA 271]
MTLDSQIAALLPALNEGFPRVEMMTGAKARAAIRARYVPPADPVPVRSVTDEAASGPGGEIPIRVYRPQAPGPLPTIVFAHGGGFVFCDMDSHDGLCRLLANQMPAVIVSVDYRRAPEHRWPAAAEDMFLATCWAVRNVRSLGGDPKRVIVCGDSAGGNLAAVTALMARDMGGPSIAAQILIYPVLDADFDTHSYREYGKGYYNTRAAMQWYWDQYLPDSALRTHPYAAPLRADLANLAPAVVVTARYDPPCTEGEAYASALKEAGVQVRYRRYDNAIHGFLTMASLDLAGVAIGRLCRDVDELLAPES